MPWILIAIIMYTGSNYFFEKSSFPSLIPFNASLGIHNYNSYEMNPSDANQQRWAFTQAVSPQP